MLIYDSGHGSTKKVAETIAKVLDIPAKKLNDTDTFDVEGLDLLIVGSPTYGGRPTPRVKEFLECLEYDELDDTQVASFDTRFDKHKHGIMLWLLMSAIHFAAPRIAKELTASGGHLILSPEGFIVDNSEGPLHDGELERAKEWAQEILHAMEAARAKDTSILKMRRL